MNKISIILVLSVLCASTATWADIPLPPSMLQKYTVQLGSDLSGVMAEHTVFQTQREILDRGCKIVEKSLANDRETVSCLMPTYCMGHRPASCTVTFVGTKGQTERDLVKILHIENP